VDTPAPGRCKQLGYIGQATGEAEWCPEASSRGDAKQPRGAADRARIPRGVKIPPSEFASYADILGLRFLELCSECAILALRTRVKASPNKLAQKEQCAGP
jgi:hypothetical protein